LQIDADLSHDPKIAPKLLKALDDGATFAVGSRYIPGGAIPENWGVMRKVYSVAGNTVVRLGLWHPGVRDWTGGYRAYFRKFYDATHSEMTKYSGYVFQIAFLHKSIHHGAVIKEIPFHFTDRLYGHSKIAPAEYIFNIYKYIALSRFTELSGSPFFKFGVVGTVGFIINTVILELLVHGGFHPAVGSALGAECAIISNFFLNNSWTFAHKKISGARMLPKLVQFNVTSLGALVIQTASVFAGTAVWGHAAYFASYIAGVGLGLIWNYTMYSRVIWKHQA
jgi:dolichol-phosphate mannosyltransferase